VKVHVAFALTPFDAVQVTVVVPFANAVPEAGAHVTVGTGHPSAVGVVNVTTAVQMPGAVFVVMFAGQAPMVTALTTVALSGAIVTGLKLSPVTFAPDPVAGLVTLQTPAGNGLLMVTWNIRVTLSPTGIVPRPWLMVSPDIGDSVDEAPPFPAFLPGEEAAEVGEAMARGAGAD